MMGLFDFLAPKRDLTEAEKKWNLMWDLWAQGDAASPYAEMMAYDGEVNNGGHYQYFFNTESSGNLQADVETLLAVLPELLRDNLKKAYSAFAAQEDADDELMMECDAFFYENEHLLTDILKEYADTLEL